MTDTYISLFMRSGSSLMIHHECLRDLEWALGSPDSTRKTISLNFAHGTAVVIVLAQIEGYCVSTPASREAFDAIVESLEGEDDSPEPWKI